MLKYTKDKNGEDILLDISKKGTAQVMMKWEEPYMKACIDKLKPKGDVLEIGFGMGYSATHIQTYNPKTYTIVECDPLVIKRCKEWAKSYNNVTIIESTWQEGIQKDIYKVYDEIFFDDQPLSYNEGEVRQNPNRLKHFIEYLTAYKKIKHGSRLSFYCSGGLKNTEDLKRTYENISCPLSIPGMWEIETDIFNVDVSDIADYHLSKDSAIVPLMIFNK